MKLFVIIGENCSERAGNTTQQELNELKAKGFEQVNHSEDFLNAVSNAEKVFFLPKDEQDIEALYDVTNMFSFTYSAKEKLLQAYAKGEPLQAYAK